MTGASKEEGTGESNAHAEHVCSARGARKEGKQKKALFPVLHGGRTRFLCFLLFLSTHKLNGKLELFFFVSELATKDKNDCFNFSSCSLISS